MSWMNFSDAEPQSSSDLIPNKTPVKVAMKIRPGGYNDPSQGWTGGYATKGATGAVYLDAEFTIIGGKYDKRKVWSLIGLHSPKGEKWGQMGRSMLRALLESARGISPTDASELATKARQINGFQDLDGLEFAAFVEIEKAEPGSTYGDKNKINTIIPSTHKDYAALMSGMGAPVSAAVAAQAQAPKASAPSWAS